MKAISTDKAPAAIGPYSQAVKTDNFIFISGQLPINPVSGEMADNIKEQTKQSLNNVTAILHEAGSSSDKILKITVFLQNMNDFADMNEVYSEFFNEPYPARAAVEVARLPKDALIEIEAVAEI